MFASPPKRLDRQFVFGHLFPVLAFAFRADLAPRPEGALAAPDASTLNAKALP